ncbi:hypothetical protein J7384_11485 [Endozoicomonas sp. G2_1]|uniref:5-oxoprolinase subunit C family protein n=1 Tax=Endozoicomonas sp. G2_1 TaxID=2821091 RepID=UPI001AD9E75E|nr:hypothetical protein [Endozoicomonas sp. G2_1]MBO9490982.1 hypothetical protein [Endozoicomonas sp. G2_1]
MTKRNLDTQLANSALPEPKPPEIDIVVTTNQCKGQLSIQDLGRPKAQHLGFSASGAADEFALLTANKLLNKTANSAALEIIFGQVKLSVSKACQFVLTGADCRAYLLSDELSGQFSNSTNEQQEKSNSKQLLSLNRLYLLKPNQYLVLQQPKYGLVSYIAFNGQLNTPSFSNSQSQTLAEQSLGLVQAPIASGDTLALTPSTESITSSSGNETDTKAGQLLQKSLANFYQYLSEQVLTLRFIPSELWQQLSSEKKHKIISAETYTIGASSNRMGYQLNHLSIPPELLAQEHTKLSKPVCYGTIQLPNANSAIVLMKERQTIGGYPTLGVVIQIDLFKLCQLRPGQKVKLIPITINQAQQQLISFYQKFDWT